MQLQIKPLKMHDFEYFCSLLNQAQQLHRELLPSIMSDQPHPLTNKELFAQVLSKSDQQLVGGFLDDQLVAFAFLQLTAQPPVAIFLPRKICYVDTLTVDKGHRRQKIGSEMMVYAEDFAREHNCDFVELNVWRKNQPAVGMYEQLGYEVTTQRMAKALK